MWTPGIWVFSALLALVAAYLYANDPYSTVNYINPIWVSG